MTSPDGNGRQANVRRDPAAESGKAIHTVWPVSWIPQSVSADWFQRHWLGLILSAQLGLTTMFIVFAATCGFTGSTIFFGALAGYNLVALVQIVLPVITGGFPSSRTKPDQMKGIASLSWGLRMSSGCVPTSHKFRSGAL